MSEEYRVEKITPKGYLRTFAIWFVIVLAVSYISWVGFPMLGMAFWVFCFWADYFLTRKKD